MKHTILCVLCALLLLSATMCAVSAEETSQETTQPTAQMPTTTSVEYPTTTEPDATTTLSDVTTTEPDVTTTTSATQPVRWLETSMTVAYDNHTVTVRVKDENGQGVRLAPVTVLVDGMTHSVSTNQRGEATLSLSNDPGEIICLLEEFQGELFSYRSARASILLETPLTTTEATPTTNGGDQTTVDPSVFPSATTEPGGSTTSAPSQTTESTADPMNGSTTATRRPLGTTRTLTTTDPEDGDVTQIVTITGVTAAAPTEPTAQSPKNSAVPKALIIGLIVSGAVLLVAAALLTYFFLIRKPRGEQEEEPIEEDIAESVEPTATVVDLETEMSEPAAEEPPAEKPTSNTTVRLEDLFRNKGE